MGIVTSLLSGILWVYTLVLWARLVLDTLRQFRPDWRPRGFGLLLAETTYTLTDPPLKLVRRVVRPVRLGGAMIDFSWTVVLIVVYILSAIVR